MKMKAQVMEFILSYDVASGSEITPCNKIDKPQDCVILITWPTEARTSLCLLIHRLARDSWSVSARINKAY